MEDGVRVVMSRVQLAAVLTGGTLSPSGTLSGRLWGVVTALGGVVELVGAGALCLTPEPTGLTKAGCVVVGAHGSDILSTGLRQTWTGRQERTATATGSSAAARHLGASPRAARHVGTAVDFAVPVGVAAVVGAIRVARVRAGRVELARHEALPGSRLGGHTIEKHIGKSEAELRARLIAKPSIPAATTFTSLQVAERAVAQVASPRPRSVASLTTVDAPEI